MRKRKFPDDKDSVAYILLTEARQHEKMEERFTDRKLTPATADFDLPAPNDDPSEYLK